MQIDITSYGPKDVNSNARAACPTLRFSVDRNTFSVAAVSHLDIKVTDRVKISQDNTDPSIWYLHKTKDGFPLHALKVKRKHKIQYYFCSSGMVTMLLKCFNMEDRQSITFYFQAPVSVKGVVYYPMTVEEIVESQVLNPEKFSYIATNRQGRGRKKGYKDSSDPQHFKHKGNGMI